MSIRASGPAPLDAVRARLIQLLSEIGTCAAQDTEHTTMPPVAPLQNAVLPEVPASVLRVLVDLAEAGVPLDILAVPERGTKAARGGLYGVQTGGVQVVSALLRAVDGGSVGIDDLNLFLRLFAVAPEVIKRAIEEQAGSESGTVTLNDTVYRLVAGRLVAERSRRGDESSGLWMKTAAIAAILLLLAIAAVRFR